MSGVVIFFPFRRPAVAAYDQRSAWYSVAGVTLSWLRRTRSLLDIDQFCTLAASTQSAMWGRPGWRERSRAALVVLADAEPALEHGLDDGKVAGLGRVEALRLTRVIAEALCPYTTHDERWDGWLLRLFDDEGHLNRLHEQPEHARELVDEPDCGSLEEIVAEAEDRYTRHIQDDLTALVGGNR